MNAIVALGDRALAHVTAAYQQRQPAAIYVLGARGSNDPALHSLEDMLEPFMDAFFSSEAVSRGQAAVAALRARADICGPLEIGDVVATTTAVLERSLEACLRMIEMLDRANILHPIELVVVCEPDEPVTATAIAWAKARGVPSVFFDAATLHSPVLPSTDAVVAFGQRARVAYAGIGITEPRLEILEHPKRSSIAVASQNRAAYRERVHTVQGWSGSDTLVAFEPDARLRGSASAAQTFDSALADMFAAYRFARERVPSLRLVVLPPKAIPDGRSRTTEIAERHGLPASELVYAETDGDIWIAVCDIVVSHESFRSVEAAAAGLPAVNLWRAASWREGPAFGADDGIIDALPETLGATLVALAQNPAVCAEIASIARERVDAFGMAPWQVSGPDSAVRVAESFLRKRRIAAPAVHIEQKLDVVIYAPSYTHASAGVASLYRVCHFINLLGGNASMYPAVLPVTHVHPTWNTPLRTKKLSDRTIVVYPEVAQAILPANRVVRWVLNVPGHLGGQTRYSDEEMVFFHTGLREAAQAATIEPLTDERELAVGTIDPELFYNDLSKPRLYDCVYIGKGEELYRRFRPPETLNALVIRRHGNPWPANRGETAALLRGCRKLYTYDAHSAIREEAILCGAQIVTIGPNGEVTEEDGAFTAYVRRQQKPQAHADFVSLAASYRLKYYDTSYVERFMRLIEQRWR